MDHRIYWKKQGNLQQHGKNAAGHTYLLIQVTWSIFSQNAVQVKFKKRIVYSFLYLLEESSGPMKEFVLVRIGLPGLETFLKNSVLNVLLSVSSFKILVISSFLPPISSHLYISSLLDNNFNFKSLARAISP